MLLSRIEHRCQLVKLIAVDVTAFIGAAQENTDSLVPYAMGDAEYKLLHFFPSRSAFSTALRAIGLQLQGFVFPLN